MFTKGTRIEVETIGSFLEGTLDRDHDDLEGDVFVVLADGYADRPNQRVRVNGWNFCADIQDDGAIYLSQ